MSKQSKSGRARTPLSPQILRILSIINFLNKPGKHTTAEILNAVKGNSEINNVSLRQIQRDLSVLEAGNVIERDDNERTVYWNIRKEHRNILPTTFNQDELLSLHTLKSYLQQFKGSVIDKQVTTLLNKLDTKAKGTVVSLTLEHNFGRYVYPNNNEILNTVIQFVIENCWVDIEYRNSIGNSKKFPVKLYRIFGFNGELYVAAFQAKHRNYLALALRNIISVHHADADYPEHIFNEAEFTKNRFGVFHGEPVKVRLTIKKEMTSFFTNRTWHPTQQFTNKPNGDVQLTLHVPLSPDLVTWILGWSQFIRVQSPKKLKAEVLTCLQKGMENNKSTE